MFKRNIYSKLLNWKQKEKRKPLILRGARQVGKSFIMKHFAETEFERFHYLNFESEKNLHSIFTTSLNPNKALELYEIASGNHVDPTTDLVIFDELQACPEAITSLKYFAEQLPTSWVLAAGSLLGLELTSASYPVGKVELLDMFPCCFSEFLAATGEQKLIDYLSELTLNQEIPAALHDKAWQTLLNYYCTGGLPASIEAFNSESNRLNGLRASREVLDTLTHLYLGDFSKNAGKENALHIERVFTAIPEQLAQAVDENVDKFLFKDVLPKNSRFSQIAGPLSWLKKASLIIQTYIVGQGESPLTPYREENKFKLYLFDTGLLGALAKIKVTDILQQDYGSYKGFYAENFIAQELRCHSVSDLFSWVGRSAEVEFVVESEKGTYPIEVKAGKSKRSRSLSVFQQKYQPSCAYVFNSQPRIISKTKESETTIREQWPLYLAFRVFNELLCVQQYIHRV